MSKYGPGIRNRKGGFKICPSCNEEFKKRYNAEKFCSFPCRLWASFSVGKNSCWNYLGGKDKDGYGLISINNKTQKAHRIFWKQFKGEIPAQNQVLHKCDNPPCVNPDHLFLGTNQDNMHDKIKKGRDRVSGEENINAILSWEQIKKIREKRKNGKSLQDISLEFKISRSHVSQIYLNKLWKPVRD